MLTPTFAVVCAALVFVALASAAFSVEPPATRPVSPDFAIDYESKVDPKLQAELERIDASLRKQFEMTEAQTAVGLLDLASDPPRLALVRPDHEEYAASVPKVGILLAYSRRIPRRRRNSIRPFVINSG